MNKDLKPGLVSIGLPLYNAATKMRPAIESLLAQDYPYFELVIADNASNDETERICKEYAAQDSRIRYIRQSKNVGQAKNMETVIGEARGEYFMLAADDDYWYPQFISKLKEALDAHVHHGVAMGSIRRIYSDGEVRQVVSYTDDLNLTSKTYAEVFDLMASERPIHLYFYGLIRTNIIQRMLQQSFQKSKAHDRVFMIEMSLVTHFYSVKDILFDKTLYRVHAKERYANEAIGRLFNDPYGHSKFVWAVVSRLLRSQAIPFSRKIRIYPYHLTAFIWRNRVFLREWSPKLFNLMLLFKRMYRATLRR